MPGRYVELRFDWNTLSDLERGQFWEQARRLAGEFLERRDRETVGGIFFNLAVSALVRVPTSDLASVVPADVTAPPDHHRDDLGTAMAWMIALRDDDATLPGVKRAWDGVITSLKEEMARTGLQ
ncbi:MAG: hypothetical protein ABR509_02495 [Candidatus Limnocylindria bacterium]